MNNLARDGWQTNLHHSKLSNIIKVDSQISGTKEVRVAVHLLPFRKNAGLAEMVYKQDKDKGRCKDNYRDLIV